MVRDITGIRTLLQTAYNVVSISIALLATDGDTITMFSIALDCRSAVSTLQRAAAIRLLSAGLG